MIRRAIAITGLILLTGCLTPAQRESGSAALTVFAASSLTEAFDEIAAGFTSTHPGVTVLMTYGSSSQLATQINEGAPAGVFAPASEAQMDAVRREIDGEPRIFATNQLVVIVPVDNPGRVETLGDLCRTGLRLVLAAPGVPVRDYTDQMLDSLTRSDCGAGYADAVYANIVSEEDNVRLVAAKVALGEADAGVVYLTDVTPELREQVRLIEVPDEFNVTAKYPIAAIERADQVELAHAFIEYVLSEPGQAILARWGFGPAPRD